MMAPWVIYALLTVVLWGVWGAVSRKLGSSLSAEQTLVLSTLGLLPIIGVLGVRRRQSDAGGNQRATRGRVLSFSSGIVSGGGNLAFYQLLGAGERAATIVPLTALYPLVTVMLALLVLRERLNRFQWLGLGLALAAIYFFNTSQDSAVWNKWVWVAMGPVVLWGVAALLQKLATNDLPGDVSTLWFLLGLLPVSLLVWVSHSMIPSGGLTPAVWGWAIFLGLALGLGNLTLLAAYAAHGKASVITPLSGLYPLVTVPLAVGWLGERVNPREWIGIVLALVAVTALTQERSPGMKEEG